MADVKDILSDENGDLLIKDGDIVIGESTKQHQKALLLAAKGSYKQFPEVGVDLRKYLLGELDLESLATAIGEEMEADGMRIQSLKLESIETLRLEAYYTQSESEE